MTLATKSHGLAVLVLALVTMTSAAPAVIDVGHRRQVFIDGRFLESTRGVHLQVHPPEKTGERCIVADRPWEQDLKPGTVLWWHGVYHMWYGALAKRRRQDDYDGVRIAYARSADGVHWKKPDLGVADFAGHRDNNIVVGYGAGGVPGGVAGGAVFEDPNAPANERLVMVIRASALGRGLHLLASGDGIHWHVKARNVVNWHGPQAQLDTKNIIFWDARRHRYVAYVRRNIRMGGNPRAGNVKASWNPRRGPRLRTVARGESPTLAKFPDVEDMPVVLGPDALDPHFFDQRVDRVIHYYDYYTSETIAYPWADDAYYMFPSGYYHYHPEVQHEFSKEFPRNAGVLDIRFAASRDGIHWQRYDREPLVRLGRKGAFDSKRAYLVYGIVPARNEHELWLYYLGTDQAHGWNRDARNNRVLTAAGLAPTENTRVISRLVLRRDGFVSVRGAYSGGEFTTPVLRFAGNELLLNVDTAAGGELGVEIEDADHEPLPGFALNDCDVVHSANAINRPVSWRGSPDVSALAGRPIRLRFVLRDCDLYAFQFRAPSDGSTLPSASQP